MNIHEQINNPYNVNKQHTQAIMENMENIEDNSSECGSEIVPLPLKQADRFYPKSRKAFEEDDSAISSERVDRGTFPAVIPLNVGGCYFMTRLSTLTRYPDSMLAAMFSGRHKLDQDSAGNYFIDTDGTYFLHILNFLRHGTLPPAGVGHLVYKDAQYYNLEELVERLRSTSAVAKITVQDAHRALFPEYEDLKHQVITVAMERAAANLWTELLIHVKVKDLPIKVPYFDKKHDCIRATAHVSYGPWETGTTQEQLMRCLEHDLQTEGFHIKSSQAARKCKYYNGVNCQYMVYPLTFFFK